MEMDEWFQTLSDWAKWGETLMFGGQGAAQCCGGMRCPMIRDTCLPKYQPTTVEALEQQRGKLGMALLGQLTVVTFRLVTGHFSGGAVGLFIFVVGNNARCSLRTSLLTSYVVLGSVAGALDVLDLLKEILSFGTGFFALPFEAHLSQNLTAISLLMAPAAEFGGARSAWDSYLRPSMLFQDAEASQSGHEIGASSSPPWFQHPLAAAVGQALYDPWAGSAAPALLAQPSTPRHRTRQHRDESWPTPSAPPELRCGRSPGQEDFHWSGGRSFQEHCVECGAELHGGRCWYGSGHYAGKAYCQQCWSAWASSSSSQPARIG